MLMKGNWWNIKNLKLLLMPVYGWKVCLFSTLGNYIAIVMVVMFLAAMKLPHMCIPTVGTGIPTETSCVQNFSYG